MARADVAGPEDQPEDWVEKHLRELALLSGGGAMPTEYEPGSGPARPVPQSGDPFAMPSWARDAGGAVGAFLGGLVSRIGEGKDRTLRDMRENDPFPNSPYVSTSKFADALEGGGQKTLEGLDWLDQNYFGPAVGGATAVAGDTADNIGRIASGTGFEGAYGRTRRAQEIGGRAYRDETGEEFKQLREDKDAPAWARIGGLAAGAAQLGVDAALPIAPGAGLLPKAGRAVKGAMDARAARVSDLGSRIGGESVTSVPREAPGALRQRLGLSDDAYADTGPKQQAASADFARQVSEREAQMRADFDAGRPVGSLTDAQKAEAKAPINTSTLRVADEKPKQPKQPKGYVDTAAGAGQREGNPDLDRVAIGYLKERGLAQPTRTYTGIDKAKAQQIAEYYDKTPDMSLDPEVQRAYATFNQETAEQAAALLRAGYKAEPWTKPGQPYKNSAEMRADVRDNKHIWYFRTEEGAPIHGAMTAEQNDTFRWVHDVFGHALRGNEFGAVGEENAWLAHSQMFSPLARKAMSTETRAQNSWVNFGPHGEFNRANPDKTIFAEQKAMLLPDEFLLPAGSADTAARVRAMVDSPLLSSDEGAYLYGDELTIGDLMDEPTTTPRAPITKERPTLKKKAIVASDLDKQAIRDRVMKATPEDIAKAIKWYDDAEDVVIDWSEKAGIPRDNAAVAMAALSPQQNWVDAGSSMDNLKSFARLVGAFVKGHIDPPFNVNMDPNQVHKAWAALLADDPWPFVNGPKEVDFALNLAGRGDYAVIDRHIAAGSTSANYKKKLALGDYKNIQKAYEEVAAELVEKGILPKEGANRTLQALDWGLISKNDLEFRNEYGGIFHGPPDKMPWASVGIEPGGAPRGPRSTPPPAPAHHIDRDTGFGVAGPGARARGTSPRDVNPFTARRDAEKRIFQMGENSSTDMAKAYADAKATPAWKRTAEQKVAMQADNAGRGGGEPYLGSQDEYFSPQSQQIMRGAKERLRPSLEQRTAPVTHEETLLAAQLSGRTPEQAAKTLLKRGQGAQAITEAALGIEEKMALADAAAAKLAGGAGSITPAERLDALFSIREAAGLLKDFAEGSSELGRALNARKIALRRSLALDPSETAWREALRKIAGAHATPDKIDKLLLDLAAVRGDKAATYRILRSLNRGSGWDMAFEYSQANILTAIPTHAVNTYSGAIQHSLMWGRVVGETALQVLWSPVFKNAAGAEDIAAFGAGYLDGLKGVSKQTYKLLRRRMDYYEYAQGGFAAKHGGETIQPGGAIPGRLGEIVRTPFKMLTIEDMFQTAPAFNARLRQLASQEARKEGLKGKAVLDRAAEIAENPSDALFREASEFAERYALHNRGEKLRTFDAFLNSMPVLRYLVRFTTTPTNLVAMGLDHSPVGLTRLVENPLTPWRVKRLSGRDRAAVMAEAAIGTAVVGSFMGMLESGEMTGLRPTNKTERDLMEAEGVGPMMIRSDKVPLVGGLQHLANANDDVNKRWVSGYVLGPLVVPYLIAAAIREVEHGNNNPDPKRMQAAVGAMVRTFADQVPMLQGIDTTQDIFENPITLKPGQAPDGAIPDLAAQTARTFVPAVSLVSMVERMVDQYRRRPEGILQTIQSVIPILAAEGIDVGPLKVAPVNGIPDVLGRAVEQNNGALALFPRGSTQRDEHPVLVENKRLGEYGFPGFTGVTKVGPTIGSGSNAITLSPDGAARYQEIAGQLTDRYVSELISSPAYTGMSDEAKAKAFQTKIEFARLEARKRLAEEHLGIVTDNNGIRSVVARVAPDKALGIAIGMRATSKLHDRADFLASFMSQIESDPALRDAVEVEMTNKPRGTLHTGSISRVVDGDTVVIGEKSYRLYGVDVPEPNTPKGREATQALAQFLTGKKITYQIDKADAFGRTLAEVYADGKSVTDWLIDQGLGQVRLPPQSDPNHYSLETYKRVIPLRQQVKSDPILSAEYVKDGQPFGDKTVWEQVDREKEQWDQARKNGDTVYQADQKFRVYAAYRKLNSQPGGKNPVRKKFIENAEKQGIPLSKFLADIVAAEDHTP